jgi:hypothetical protein
VNFTRIGCYLEYLILGLSFLKAIFSFSLEINVLEANISNVRVGFFKSKAASFAPEFGSS